MFISFDCQWPVILHYFTSTHRPFLQLTSHVRARTARRTRRLPPVLVGAVVSFPRGHQSMAGTRRRKARQATATAGKDVADATGSATPAAIPAPDEPVPRAQGIHNWLDAAVAVALLAPTAYMWTKIRTTDVRSELAWGLALSVAVFGVVVFFIPLFAERTRKAGLWGKDLCKRGTVRENVKVYAGVRGSCGLLCGR